jgi:hypothetical protein
LILLFAFPLNPGILDPLNPKIIVGLRQKLQQLFRFGFSLLKRIDRRFCRIQVHIGRDNEKGFFRKICGLKKSLIMVLS